jgi:hypothetical protein
MFPDQTPLGLLDQRRDLLVPIRNASLSSASTDASARRLELAVDSHCLDYALHRPGVFPVLHQSAA